jgi:hypothetical protein
VTSANAGIGVWRRPTAAITVRQRSAEWLALMRETKEAKGS